MNEIEEILAKEMGGLMIQLARAQALLNQRDATIAELEKALAVVQPSKEATDGAA